VSTNLRQAVREAGTFIGSVGEADGRDAVDVTLAGAWGHPPLTMGTLRALYELAEWFVEMCGEYTPEEIARVYSRSPRNVRPSR
jgi:hypothetical protein